MYETFNTRLRGMAAFMAYQPVQEKLQWKDAIMLWLFTAGFVSRATLFVLAYIAFDISLSEFTRIRDGDDYLAFAKAIAGDASDLLADPYHERVFPGYPALIALVHLSGLSLETGAILVNWASVGFVAILTSKFFADGRLGWAIVALTPSYVMYSALVLTEPTLLLFTMLGLTALKAGWIVPAGLALGYAGTIRPMACFAVLGAMVLLGMQKNWIQAMLLGGIAAALVGAASGLQYWYLGDALHNLHAYQQAYAGQLFAWPFESLVMTPLRSSVATWKVFYIWSYVVITLLACIVLWQRWIVIRRNGGDLRVLTIAAVWLVGNTLFSLCVGNIWGFHEFHRFVVPALPAMLLAYQPVLPSKPQYWLLIFVPSFAMALFGLVHARI